MSGLEALQTQFAYATYQAERYAREAEIAKAMLMRLAGEAAAAKFATPDECVQAVHEPSPTALEINATPAAVTGLPPEVKRSLGFIGLFTRVAKEAEVSVSHVAKVAKGTKQSKRIVAALVREVRTIDGQTDGAA